MIFFGVFAAYLGLAISYFKIHHYFKKFYFEMLPFLQFILSGRNIKVIKK